MVKTAPWESPSWLEDREALDWDRVEDWVEIVDMISCRGVD
jgi:hypothetical protein